MAELSKADQLRAEADHVELEEAIEAKRQEGRERIRDAKAEAFKAAKSFADYEAKVRQIPPIFTMTEKLAHRELRAKFRAEVRKAPVAPAGGGQPDAIAGRVTANKPGGEE